jgi:cyanophycin synthetase
MPTPDPWSEIRLVSLRSLRGANYWSPRPVTRVDLAVGAYDEISSADVPGLAESLLDALPGLVEHRCSIGERGGFLSRLWRGTYAPHIVEHVALELQAAVGHDVGYGRARGGDRPGEYTVVLEHLHAEVGLRAAALALELVQRAFAGAAATAQPALLELRALAALPAPPPPRHEVLCAVTGGGDRVAARDELLLRTGDEEALVVEVSPAYVLNAGLPYSRSEVAVVVDAELRDVPERYREPESARRLLSVVADAVPRDGLVVVPARERELQALVREAGRRVGVFTAEAEVPRQESRLAHAVASVRDGRIVLERGGETIDAGARTPDASAAAQAAAALALLGLERTPTQPEERDGRGG